VYKKFREEYHLSLDEASLLSETPEIAEFFENTVSLSKDPKKSANWILSELFRYLNEKNIPLKKSPLPEKHIAEIINAINSGEISGKIAKEVFAESFHTQKSPADIIKNSGLKVNSNEEELISICKTVLEENKALVQEYKNGKDKLFGAFVGQVMKKTQGKGNPVMITEILKKELHTD
jgi:aspartyl-tRNA(Asn)/glutamyl-tRNA(Gln) amidotransferase subunit B